jgi:PAS domain S-box-containing protein/putative nucleotidyltransferase with HDIG domain
MLTSNEFSSPSTQKRVGELLSNVPLTVLPATALGEAAKTMESAGQSCLLVAHGKHVAGIVTERDIIRALNSHIPIATPVEAIMTRDVIGVSASEELHKAYHTMVVHRIRHLLVVDDVGQPVGVLSETDFRKQRGVESFIGALDVTRVMSQDFLEMSVDSLATQASNQLQKRVLECAIVTEHGKPIGILTERDLVRLYHRQLLDAKIDEVMSKPVLTIKYDALLIDAANLMKEKNVKRLVVTDVAGNICGILNEHDLVKNMEDEYIQMLQHLVFSQAQALTEDRFRALVNHLPQKICVKHVNSVYLASNSSYADDLGITPQAIVGKTDYDFFPPELASRYQADDKKVMADKTIITFEEPYLKNGDNFWIQTTKAPMYDHAGNVNGVVVIFEDITQRKHDQELINRRSWAIKALSRGNEALVYAKTEEELIQLVCDSITSENYYLLAWFGWAVDNEHKEVKITASSGIASGYLKGFQVSWGENELGNGPSGRAIKSGKVQVNNAASDNSAFAPWQSRAAEFGIGSSISLPVQLDDRVVGALTVYAKEKNAFDSEEIALFEKLASNVGYGIESRRTSIAYEAELKHREEQAKVLEKSLEDALMAISATLEHRDPYTAGHQKRVAELAIQIGRELGLNEFDLHGLYLAAVVHDIGKIQIPAEILVKPTRLSPQEFRLIQNHPEAGYDILSKIDFPWPLAEIIRQHHEYLDGSGYPRALKGNEILIEAKILAVADIVESMSSDRPYRPALGLGAAIAQINSWRGSKLDAGVVDACTSILQRGDYIPAHLELGIEL